MSIKRWGLDCVSEEEADDGKYVFYSDHAAELARVEGERDSLAKSIMAACKGSGCLNAHELRAALDHTHKRATNAENEVKRLGRVVADYAVFPYVEDAKQHAEILDADEEEGTEPRGVMPLYGDPTKAIALLRAECEAWRACKGFMDERMFWAAAWTYEDGKAVIAARAATDAAGILARAAVEGER